jgi:glutamyl-tRNA synthetase
MVKTRIAPSPTGYIHIGTLRTALFNLFLAKQNQGKFILRIEDTDQERFVEGATDSLISVMSRLGIHFDEGPFFQSERLPIYKEHVQTLLDAGHAYYDFATKEELEAMREAQRATKQPMKYDRSRAEFDQARALERIAAGEVAVVRLLVPEGETVVSDLIRGEVKFNNAEIDDQVLLKSDGFPTYHLAVVVDDHLMEITHVVRGEEWLPSTPKHLMLYKMFGWEIPLYAHVPLLLNPDKSKLSKRQGDVAVEDYIKAGYPKQALLNFIATLGYNPTGDREIYTMEELTQLFDISKVNRSGAVLNKEKLEWMSNQYLKSMTVEEIVEEFKDFSTHLEADESFVKKCIQVERERAKTYVELNAQLESYFWSVDQVPDMSEVLVWKQSTKEGTTAILSEIATLIGGLSEDALSSVATVESAVKAWIEANGKSNGEVLSPLRLALSGMQRSASPFEYIWVLGKEASVMRINRALELLNR